MLRERRRSSSQRADAHGGSRPHAAAGETKGDAKGAPSSRDPLTDVRCSVAELLGTFGLTLVAAGGEVIGKVSGGEVERMARVAAPGLLVAAFIYAFGDVSGAHFNPAVTLAFALRRDFPWKRVPMYWLFQLLGAIAAAGLLRLTFGPVGDLGATTPQFGVGPALVVEIVLTWMLVTVILGTATRYSLLGPNSALAVGSTIALCGLFASPVSGASMNPARSLGPALVAGRLSEQWIYVAGPAVGSVLAVLFMAFVHRKKDPEEKKAAAGDGKA